MKSELTQEDIEQAALKAMEQFGAPKDVFIPGYGWILKDGKATDVGLSWYQEQMVKDETR